MVMLIMLLVRFVGWCLVIVIMLISVRIIMLRWIRCWLRKLICLWF